jgi:hypothetical protein
MFQEPGRSARSPTSTSPRRLKTRAAAHRRYSFLQARVAAHFTPGGLPHQIWLHTRLSIFSSTGAFDHTRVLGLLPHQLAFPTVRRTNANPTRPPPPSAPPDTPCRHLLLLSPPPLGSSWCFGCGVLRAGAEARMCSPPCRSPASLLAARSVGIRSDGTRRRLLTWWGR